MTQRIILGVLLSLFLTACGRGNIHIAVRPYYDKFYEEASKRGIYPDEVQNIHFGDANAECEGDRVAGCAIVNVFGGPTIVIDTKVWGEITEGEREILVFHELGHAVLNKGHSETTHTFLDAPSLEQACFLTDYIELPNIMYPSLPILPAKYANYRDGLLDEFFGTKPFPTTYKPASGQDLDKLLSYPLYMNCCQYEPDLGFCT
jgi:hypothetical protein